MTFDDILADCIAALEQGATIHECVARYPAHATALEPLLRLVASLSHESQTRLSSPAFQRGRQMLLAQAQQRQAQHRQPVYPPARQAQPAAYAQNGLPPRPRHGRRPVMDRRTWGHMGIPRLLRTALLLMLLLSATTFFRQVMTSLPGAILYPVKNSGEQLVGVLMEAAGEGVSWHATQTERHLQELAQLTDPDTMTVQTLSTAVETHWEAMLIASEGLPTTERDALLQTQIARLRQLETAWTTPQTTTAQPAVATLRKLITTGEEALGQPQPIDHQTEVVETVTATVTSTVASTVVETVTVAPSPTVTPTLLLQATATPSITQPILVPSPTPTASPTLAAPPVDLATSTVELPSPTEPVSAPPTTPLPEITVQMPEQESSHQDEDEESNDSDKTVETETATPPTSPPTEVTPGAPTPIITPDVEDGTATTEPTVATATAATPLPLTPVTPEVQPTLLPASPTAPATVSVENTPAIPTKTAPSATGTAAPTFESAATATARPTNQATATKTPKPTATHVNAPTATPNGSDNATAAPPTAVENTPSATTQPTTAPRDEAVQTPGSVAVTPVFSQPVKPRPTTPGGEPTKAVQP